MESTNYTTVKLLNAEIIKLLKLVKKHNELLKNRQHYIDDDFIIDTSGDKEGDEYREKWIRYNNILIKKLREALFKG